jgi:glycerol-3-phosphate cytidylyltransferase|tara:strand:- start:100 stop:504 length:405 start_codon:yes stop_codon:yes gene_type:complete
MGSSKIGFVAGNFDLIHPGYIKLFQFAKKHCDFLIVAIHKDPSLERNKKFQPIHSLKERKMIIESIKYVDKTLCYKYEKDLIILLKKIPISVRFLDENYQFKKITGKELDIPIKWVPRNHTYSTTNLVKKIKLL